MGLGRQEPAQNGGYEEKIVYRWLRSRTFAPKSDLRCSSSTPQPHTRLIRTPSTHSTPSTAGEASSLPPIPRPHQPLLSSPKALTSDRLSAVSSSGQLFVSAPFTSRKSLTAGAGTGGGVRRVGDVELGRARRETAGAPGGLGGAGLERMDRWRAGGLGLGRRLADVEELGAGGASLRLVVAELDQPTLAVRCCTAK